MVSNRELAVLEKEDDKKGLIQRRRFLLGGPDSGDGKDSFK